MVLKPAAFALLSLPVLRLAWLGLHARLSANPVEFVEHRTGDWALNLLVLGLCMTPLARWTKRSEPIKLRRMIGLFAFFYASIHFLTWLSLDNEFSWPDLLDDLKRRRFILVGFSALVLLVPLAITSTDGWIKRLGRNWGRLHKLVYPATILACVHYYWLVKADHAWPLRYAAAVGALLAVRALGLI